jgi:hypothetical protein
MQNAELRCECLQRIRAAGSIAIIEMVAFGAELPMQLQANYAGSCPKATVRDT